jgi:ketosteroid isomerase-like protein
MKRAMPIFLAVLFTSLPLESQQAANRPALQSAAQGATGAELITLTKAWINAVNAKDRPKLEALMAPDFTLYGWDGELWAKRPQWLENLFHIYSKIDAYEHKDIAPRVYGDFANVTSTWYWRGTRSGEPFEEHGYVVDTWRKANGRWQVVSRTSVTLPGKPSSTH